MNGKIIIGVVVVVLVMLLIIILWFFLKPKTPTPVIPITPVPVPAPRFTLHADAATGADIFGIKTWEMAFKLNPTAVGGTLLSNSIGLFGLNHLPVIFFDVKEKFSIRTNTFLSAEIAASLPLLNNIFYPGEVYHIVVQNSDNSIVSDNGVSVNIATFTIWANGVRLGDTKVAGESEARYNNVSVGKYIIPGNTTLFDGQVGIAKLYTTLLSDQHAKELSSQIVIL